MTIFFRRISRVFKSADPVPVELRRTFFHLYGDIAWFGILSGTTIAFLAVYATRQGATAQQIGWLTAAPGLVNLIFALPAASLLTQRSIGRSVFWTSILQRVFYLLLIPLPIMLLPNTQVRVIILMTLVMTIPGTVVVVGFNALFGEVVPLEWRGYVVGIRNALLSIITVVFTIISGVILDGVVFPTGYQIVFGLGVIGALMSSAHLYFLSKIVGERENQCLRLEPPRAARRGRLVDEIPALFRRSIRALRLDAMQGHFARMMILLFTWHVFQYMSIPTVTPFVVNILHVNDQTIGIAAALFNIMTFFGSVALNRLTFRFGNQSMTASGIMLLSLFPILTAFGTTTYLLANLIGGLAWALAGGALYNYILENIPADDRPVHLAWYNLVLNAAILLGSLAGPAIALSIGFPVALVLFGIGRGLAGAAILKWG